MKLQFTRKWWDTDWAPSGLGELVQAWFGFLNIYMGECRTDFEITYNDFYHFYDLQLYEIPGNFGDPQGHWDPVIAWLRGQGYDVTVTYDVWRWERDQGQEPKMIRGVRLWIKPKEQESI
jgi:hypothetical protein